MLGKLKKILLSKIIILCMSFSVILIIGKVVDVQFAEPCGGFNNAPIVSEVGPFWVKLAGDDEIVLLGTRTKLPGMADATSEEWLVSLKDEEIKFVVIHKFWNLVRDQGIEKQRNICQYTISGNDPVFQPHDPEILLIPSDLTPSWRIKEFTQFSSYRAFTFEEEFEDNYSVEMEVKTDWKRDYMIWFEYYSFANSGIAETEFNVRSSEYRYTGEITHIQASEGNSRGFCHYEDTYCKYIIQKQEHMLVITVRSTYSWNEDQTISIPLEDWQYLVELTTEKFLAALEG